MPTNLYGPGDNYHPDHSRVLPALIRRFHEAVKQGKTSPAGLGKPLREFLHVDDLGEACCWSNGAQAESQLSERRHGLGPKYPRARRGSGSHNFTGTIHWDTSKPDGTQKKHLM